MGGQIFMLAALFQFFVSWTVYEDEPKSMDYLFSGSITFLIAFTLIMGTSHATPGPHHPSTLSSLLDYAKN